MAISKRIAVLFLSGSESGTMLNNNANHETWQLLAKNETANQIRDVASLRASLIIRVKDFSTALKEKNDLSKQVGKGLFNDEIAKRVFEKEKIIANTPDEAITKLTAIIFGKFFELRKILGEDYQDVHDLICFDPTEVLDDVRAFRDIYNLSPYKAFIKIKNPLGLNKYADTRIPFNTDAEFDKWYSEESKYHVKPDNGEAFAEFYNASKKLKVFIDAENANVYKTLAFVEKFSAKIAEVIIVGSNYADNEWEMFDKYCTVPVQYVEDSRVKDTKSICDHILIIKLMTDMYENLTDHGNAKPKFKYVVMSSDSDFLALTISPLLNGRIAYAYEDRYISNETLVKCKDADIPTIKIDSMNDDKATMKLLNEYMIKQINKSLNIGIEDILKSVQLSTRSRQLIGEKGLDKVLTDATFRFNKDGKLEIA